MSPSLSGMPHPADQAREAAHTLTERLSPPVLTLYREQDAWALLCADGCQRKETGGVPSGENDAQHGDS